MVQEGTAAWYRQRASELRELATKSRDPAMRLDQLRTAQQFDLLAQRAEAKEAETKEQDKRG